MLKFGDDELHLLERLPGEYLVYENGVPRALTDMEHILLHEIIDRSRPLSKSALRDACTECGEVSKNKCLELEGELATLRQKLMAAQYKILAMGGTLDGEGATEADAGHGKEGHG